MIDNITKALQHSARVKEYQDWIEKNISEDPNHVLRTCAEATLEMKKVFPELQRVRGLVHTIDRWEIENKYPHWWLTDPWDSSIVDPTVLQFCLCIISAYVPADEARGELTGKCPNCGGICYDHEYLCSDKCDKEYRDYTMTGELW